MCYTSLWDGKKKIHSFFQELSVEHDEKKGIYDTTAAGLESNMSRLEQVSLKLFLLVTFARSR